MPILISEMGQFRVVQLPDILECVGEIRRGNRAECGDFSKLVSGDVPLNCLELSANMIFFWTHETCGEFR